MLQITAKLCKKKINIIRIIISSAAGGIYSFIILLDSLPVYIVFVTKIFAALIMILIAFNFFRVKNLMQTLGVFIFSSFVLLGVITGILYITETPYIAINNSSVYFDVSSKQLIVCALIAYLLSCLVVRLHNRSVSNKQIYTIEIENEGKSVTLFAFADTGNKLREPFSNYPVIIVRREFAEKIVGNSKLRLIPATTVNNSSTLKAFKPDNIKIKGSKKTEIIENAYVAMSDEINSDSFSAIINPEILSV